ncbi:right-handed parallel beta-helix repeat-containing protein, partial [Thermodesulfobacteriota bacterium]
MKKIINAVFLSLMLMSVANAMELNSCQDITEPGEYILLNDVSSDGTCFSITVDDVILDGNGYTIRYDLSGDSTHNDRHYGVSVIGKNIVIKNVRIIDGTETGSVGVGIYGSLIDSVIANNYVETNGETAGYGIYANLYNVTISENTFIAKGTGKGNLGLRISGGRDNTIINNRIDTYGTNNNTGIYLEYSPGNFVENNIVNTHGTEYYNFGIASWGSKANDNTIRGNTVSTQGEDHSNYGIYLLSANNNLVEDNIVSTGIESSGRNNNGIRFYYGGSHIIRNNIISTDGEGGNHGMVVQHASYNFFEQNTINTNGTSNSNHGIYILGGSTENSIIENSITTGGTSYGAGVVFNTSGNNIVERNTILTTGTWGGGMGVSVHSGQDEMGDGNIIRDNSISTTGTYGGSTGINVGGYAKGTIIEGNTVEVEHGVYSGHGVHIQAYENFITNNDIK